MALLAARTILKTYSISSWGTSATGKGSSPRGRTPNASNRRSFLPAHPESAAAARTALLAGRDGGAAQRIARIGTVDRDEQDTIDQLSDHRPRQISHRRSTRVLDEQLAERTLVKHCA